MLHIFLKMGNGLTCIARNPPQDACQAGQRSASPAVVHLQHGQVLISDMRRNNQILQIPLVDFRNLIQPQFLQQRVLHILMRKSLGETKESGAQDTSAEEIHEWKKTKKKLEWDKLQHSSTSHPEMDGVPLTLRGPLYIVVALPVVRTLSMGAGTLIRTKVRQYSPIPNRISKWPYFKQQQLDSSAIRIVEV